MSYEQYKLTKADFEKGIDDFFTQLLIEARVQKKDAANLKDLSTENPTISYLIGQAGCGKTTLRRFIRKDKYEKNNECVVELDADKLATFHKYYEQLIKLPPDNFYSLTRDFVKPGNKVIHKTIIDNKLNVVKEKVMHRGEADFQEILEFKNGGYNIDMNAIDSWESFLCCIERDLKLIENGFDPRRVTRADHDRMYEPFIGELQELSEKGLCDSVHVFGRGETVEEPKLLYAANNPTKKEIAESVKTLKDERLRMHK